MTDWLFISMVVLQGLVSRANHHGLLYLFCHPFLQRENLMLEKHAIEEVDPATPGFYSTFFLVPKKDRGQRPVLNLEGLDQYLDVKMQTPQMVIGQLHPYPLCYCGWGWKA